MIFCLCSFYSHDSNGFMRGNSLENIIYLSEMTISDKVIKAIDRDSGFLLAKFV